MTRPRVQTMTERSNRTPSRACDARRHLWRLLWVVLLAIHAGAVPAAVRGLPFFSDATFDASTVFRFAGLLLAAAFCLLKVADVPWLRIRPGWRGSVSIAVVLALLHVSVLHRARDGDVALAPSQVGVFLFVGTSLNLDLARRSLRVLVAELRATHDRGAADRPLCGATYASAPLWSPIGLDSLTSPLAPRPPPHFALSFVS